MHDPAQRPATLLPPPLVYAVFLILAWWLDDKKPLPFALGESGVWLGGGLIGLGLLGFVWALAAIWGHRTTVNPYKAASHLVTRGPFRYSRNPIYVSDWLIYAGVSLLLDTLWAMIFAPAVWAIMRFAVIAHEEAHLEAKFGAEYQEYKAKVRRWV